jgi:AcrR family transcriptional regulator
LGTHKFLLDESTKTELEFKFKIISESEMALTLVQPAETLPKQKRSRARRAAMMVRGLELLKERDLEAISIIEITGGLGYSSGSFYSAFTDKEAFFVAVQHAANEQMIAWIEDEIETPELAAKLPAERLSLCINLVLRYFRTYRGVIRSALRYEQKMPAAWAPNRVSAQRIADGLIAGLAEDDAARVRVAIQMAFGAMVNALLHDPGPLRLDDEAFGPSVIAALTPYLTVNSSLQK